MNRLAAVLGRLPRTSYPNIAQTQFRSPCLKAGATHITQQSQLSTSTYLYNNAPAGDQERPELPNDKNRTAQSPKSSDEKILDRAQEGDKGKAPFTEEEQKRKQIDKKEGYGEGEAEDSGESRGRNN